MAKKEITFRPMFGFTDRPPTQTLAEATRKYRDEPSKDQIIAELRAKIAELEAKEEKRRIASRESMRKKRAK